MANNAEPSAGAAASGQTGTDQGSAAVERLKTDIQSLRNDIEAAARTVNQLGADAAQEAMQQAHVQMQQLRDRLDDFIADAQAYSNRSTEALRQQVQERPFASLLVALATGFVLAHLISRR